MKRFLWVGLLASGLQTASAFSLSGPSAAYAPPPKGDLWQIVDIGYNPMGGFGPPWFIDGLATGPKNQGEGYRYNVPTLYYTFNSSFGNYFGSNGEVAVVQAFDILNNLPNVDSCSPNLTEFPLNSESENYTAYGLGLRDLKSTTLTLMMGQLGLDDAVRYTWCLHDRYVPTGATCLAPEMGNGLEYVVIQRNFGIVPSSLDTVQYSPYVNGELYSYYIYETCGTFPPLVDAVEIPVDPINNNPPVASGDGEDVLPVGYFYTGLTRDDVAGLRWLYSSNNFDTPSPGYQESSVAGSVLVSSSGGGAGGLGPEFALWTSNYTVFAQAALTNDPATLSNLFPGLEITSYSNYFVFVPVVTTVAYYTNYLGAAYGSGNQLVTTYVTTTNVMEYYAYTFANVITYQTNINASAMLLTIDVGTNNPSPGTSYYGTTTLTTNTSLTSTTLTNVPSGDYYISTNPCGPDVVVSPQPPGFPVPIVEAVTNLIYAVSNSATAYHSVSLVTYSTNHILIVQSPICAVASTNSTSTNTTARNYQGIGRIQFVRVADANYDSSSGLFYHPITNQYAMLFITNGMLATNTFQRVVTAPDFVFDANDQASGPSTIPIIGGTTASVKFDQDNEGAGLAGPGIINPGGTIAFTKVGTAYLNESPSYLNGPTNAAGKYWIWGSFDGTTNAPVVYPNGTSLVNLAAEALIQISPPPPTLPDGTNTFLYGPVTLSATGGQSPYTWLLTTNSLPLPLGLNLLSGGVISGTPTNNPAGMYDFTIQMNDSSGRSVAMDYSITIDY